MSGEGKRWPASRSSRLADKTEMRKCFVGERHEVSAGRETEREETTTSPARASRLVVREGLFLCARPAFQWTFWVSRPRGFRTRPSCLDPSFVLLFKSSRRVCALFAHQLRFSRYPRVSIFLI